MPYYHRSLVALSRPGESRWQASRVFIFRHVRYSFLAETQYPQHEISSVLSHLSSKCSGTPLYTKCGGTNIVELGCRLNDKRQVTRPRQGEYQRMVPKATSHSRIVLLRLGQDSA